MACFAEFELELDEIVCAEDEEEDLEAVDCEMEEDDCEEKGEYFEKGLYGDENGL